MDGAIVWFSKVCCWGGVQSDFGPKMAVTRGKWGAGSREKWLASVSPVCAAVDVERRRRETPSKIEEGGAHREQGYCCTAGCRHYYSSSTAPFTLFARTGRCFVKPRPGCRSVFDDFSPRKHFFFSRPPCLPATERYDTSAYHTGIYMFVQMQANRETKTPPVC